MKQNSALAYPTLKVSSSKTLNGTTSCKTWKPVYRRTILRSKVFLLLCRLILLFLIRKIIFQYNLPCRARSNYTAHLSEAILLYIFLQYGITRHLMENIYPIQSASLTKVSKRNGVSRNSTG